MPASLQELNLNNNLPQGLQRSSFRGAGRPPGTGAKGAGPEQPRRPRAAAVQGGLAGGQTWERQPRKAAPAPRAGGSLELRWAAPSRPSELGGQLTCPSTRRPQGSASCSHWRWKGSHRLHDGNISPLAFQPLRSLLYLRLDRNRLRTIPPGLPASLQVSWEPRGHKRQSCGRKTGASAHASQAGG